MLEIVLVAMTLLRSKHNHKHNHGAPLPVFWVEPAEKL